MEAVSKKEVKDDQGLDDLSPEAEQGFWNDLYGDELRMRCKTIGYEEAFNPFFNKERYRCSK